MDRNSRIIFLVLVVALSAWRLIRYLRMGMSRRSTGIVSGAGMLVQQGIAPADADLSPALHQPRSARARIMGSVVGVLVLILSNALIVYVLFGLPPLEEAPPLIRLVIAVLPNFYLIPFARRLAARWP
jgi:hypothetical protein